MSTSDEDLVTEFCANWSSPDPGVLAGYFTPDAVYHNIPMEPVHGRDAIREFIENFLKGFDGIDFEIHRQVSGGGFVLNERTDSLRKGTTVTPLPVMGSFQIVDGRIAAWRDYFDLNTIMAALSG
ncbi:limonene-1,2-epoxide hydrolase family protein [Amycolatopsis sp.]|uniref:limonene-1,2-epoxide hydrolase family protein n=1 Tax=Amycolatopsis sp. TaxID=37632 RepID=UPI002CF52A7C|nr:limonene-1,2-epoxide hydrolase family protein [Amycolatopsis sp.]HVV13680.1 limonene-1,2-epoxide hydrolase family protein [Amycolatopsis sp.]